MLTPKQWAILAQQSYSSIPDLGPEDSAGRVCFVQSEQGLILAVPGTNNERCVLADVEAIPYDAGACGMVHKGIWQAFDPIWPDVAKLTVYTLVGHSEGGAGVLYLGARLCLIGKPPKVIYAWEPPRASIDTNLAEIFSKYRVVVHIMKHGNDVVPDLPPSMPGLDWQHPGPVTQFGKAWLPIPNIEDHLIAGIIEDL